MEVSTAARVPRVVVLLLALAIPASAALAQEPVDLVNFAHVAKVGFGGFTLSGRSVQVVRIPFSWTLKPLEDNPWGLRLTLPISFGVHDLNATVDGELMPLDRLRTLTFEPGVELLVPVGSETVFKPFVEGGFGRETETSGTTVYLYSAGFRSLTTREVDRLDVSVGTKLEWNGVTGEEGGSDDYGAIEVGFESIHPLPASLAGRQLDLGPYVIFRYFYSDLVFERLGAPAIAIEGQIELGMSLGTQEPLRLWGIQLPRLGLAYKFGDGLTAWRINFGFPF
jgi:hypothetical protein